MTRETVGVLCDYCGQPAQLVTGQTIYPHRPDLFALNFWNCAPCGAYVGCHIGMMDAATCNRVAAIATTRAQGGVE